MLRSSRALVLLWTVFASYGWYWLLSQAARLLGFQERPDRLERVHLRNARRLATGFSRLGGVFIKMGQVLSVIGTFLPRAFGEALEKLQDQVPPRPFSEIEARLREAFGQKPLARFRCFEREPIAAASLAQVHRAVSVDGRELAVKVLYPGIERAIRRDLRVLRSVLPVAKLLIPVSRMERVLGQLGAMLARETDYANERKNIERIRDVLGARGDVVIPLVIPELTRANVLTMSFEAGIKISDRERLEQAGIEGEAVARILVDCYMTMLLDRHVFHADPHPGNFFVRPGPKLVIVDYGAVEEVSDALAEGMKGVVGGVLARDDDQILRGLERMGFVAANADRELLAGVGREYLKILGSFDLRDFGAIDRDFIEVLYRRVRGRLREVMHSVEYPEGFFYVERALVLLFGLVAQLAPRRGLPGIALPFAAQAVLRGRTTRRAAPDA